MKKYINIISFLISIFITYVVFSLITGNSVIFFEGLFSSLKNVRFIEKMLTKTTMIILISLAMFIFKKVGIFDIAAPGKFCLGLLIMYLSVYYIGGSSLLKVLVGFIVGFTTIFILSNIILILKVKFNINEVAFGLMFNFLALFIYESVMHLDNDSILWIEKSTGSLVQLGKLTNFALGEGEVSIFIIPAIILPFIMFIFFKYTPIGFKIIIVGEGKSLAKNLGINATKKYFIATTISSLMIAISLLTYLFSERTGQLSKSIIAAPSIVWTGIVISLIVTINPLTIFAYSFIFSLIYCSETYMQSVSNIDPRTIKMTTGILMMSMAVTPCFKKLTNSKIVIKISCFKKNINLKLYNFVTNLKHRKLRQKNDH